MIPISQLLTPLTAAQIRTTIVSALVALGIPADQWLKGATFSTILTYVSQILANFSSLMCSALAGQFLPTASGSWLVLLAYYVYGVTAQAATFASGSLTLTNAGGGVYSYAAGAATFVNSLTGKTYTNVNAFVLSGLATLSIPIQATSTGSAGSATPGSITILQTVMLGVTCTNPGAVVGLDAQSDDSLRDACLAAMAATSVRGPRTAYRWATLNATNGGAPVNINRVSVSESSSTGVVTVTMASPSGAPLTGDVTAAAANINATVRPAGVTVVATAATQVNYSNAITVYATALPGLTASAIQTAAENALDAWFALYPVNGLAGETVPSGYSGQVYASGVGGVIKATNSAIFDVEGTTNLPLMTGQVAANETTISVVLVAA